MKSKGQINYSTKELKQMKTAVRNNKALPKPLSTSRLAKSVAKELGRSYTGVYYKMLHMMPVRTKRTAVAAPKVMAKKSISFGKPSKIEISDSGMTFYF
jgi:hypothetical protein